MPSAAVFLLLPVLQATVTPSSAPSAPLLDMPDPPPDVPVARYALSELFGTVFCVCCVLLPIIPSPCHRAVLLSFRLLVCPDYILAGRCSVCMRLGMCISVWRWRNKAVAAPLGMS
jgi:hypothetical protein